MLDHRNPTPKPPSRAVVIGAGGFVGGAILRKLRADGIDAVSLTRRELDLTVEGAAEQLAAMLRPDDSVVVVSAVAPAKTIAQLMLNLRMVEAACAALAKSPVVHLVYISSDAVYADDANPVTERSCCQPSSLHGMMHAARELMLKSATKAPYAVLRPTLIYGAADPHNGYGPNRFRRQAAKGEPIVLFGEGEERRDHVLIDDVAQIAALMLAHRSAGALNVATGQSFSFRQVAEMAAAEYSPRVPIQGTKRQNPVTHRHFDTADCLKAFPQFGYTPLADGIKRVCAETREAR
ncbi:MAG: SDR family oxidoreductase [Proteobacteria bacterium]|nr:SDR family oxidoreductase [Pseudomonadota bacterium]